MINISSKLKDLKMFTVNKPKFRFNLILMDEGEYYFDDYSASYYPPAETDEESFQKKVKGRILVCSNSIFFEPDDVKQPILKFPFKEVTNIDQLIYQLNVGAPSVIGGLGGSGGFSQQQQQQQRSTRSINLPTNTLASLARTEIFFIQTNQVVEMKENNVNAPYKFIKVTRANFRFSLNYVNLDAILMNMRDLLTYSKQDRQDHDRLIKSLIEERENRLQLDYSLLVDMNERNMLEMKCCKISPLVENPGRFLVTNSRIYFQPMNNIEAQRINHFNLDSIIKILKRRHSLREIGLEIFFDDESSLFFTFKNMQSRNQVYNLLNSECKNIPHNNEQKNYLLRWQNGILSNYEYLLYLNNLAGRTYNDLTQYPVFPWVISDYTSQTLDLANTAIYRDLSKPIGALNPTRLSMFQERYHQIPDPQPKFLYGTHYSAPAYVLYYLVRQAPEYMLRLQNGRFDSPNRMFHSLEETWNSVYNSTSDVKELIPEFYEPGDRGEFLLNRESLELGVRQDGKVLGDIILPPWASSPEQFIITMREALESEYVSQNLHNWIDLIFGFKQLGDESVKANNVFYHLTYEGSVDIESITDPFERQGLEAQINEFGQTPRQLFKTPHPQRLPLALRNHNLSASSTNAIIDQANLSFNVDDSGGFNSSGSTANSLAMSSNSNFSTSSNNSNYNSDNNIPALQRSMSGLSFNNSNNNSSNMNKSQSNSSTTLRSWGSIANLQLKNSFKNHKDKVTSLYLSENSDIIYSVSQDASLKIYSSKEKKQVRSLNLCELALSSCQLSGDEKHIVIGSWDNNIYIYSVDNGSIQETLCAHDDAISCLKLNNDVLVSGSWDSTIKVWKVMPSSVGINIGNIPIADFIESESEIRSVDISPNGLMCIAGSEDGTLFTYDLRSLSLISKQRIYSDAISCVKFTPDGLRIIASSTDGSIKMIGIEGSEIFNGSIDDQINCFDTDGISMVVGCENGLRLWSLSSGNEIKDLSSVNSDSVQSINVSFNSNGKVTLLTGAGSGTIHLWETN
ncbi:BEACH domain-containing protein [Heterostelium album PN500]|uniref:BEACH domain-containing protein n=1 Tax=Heterostelium pallidum (strain ATCC 26659 / Pp 5 / PN500) TaxID=670386 RepID=D3BQI1_HETP5|nr:BEACH domain-containing protein [Heterostelium album PN500]EFA76401.1 BEACH domain-containing protein [Heterostelium album PN500]|eukprot:XP_020428533.1 BEACH domain-containing protein [Heterostelium album PN500]